MRSESTGYDVAGAVAPPVRCTNRDNAGIQIGIQISLANQIGLRCSVRYLFDPHLAPFKNHSTPPRIRMWPGGHVGLVVGDIGTVVRDGYWPQAACIVVGTPETSIR